MVENDVYNNQGNYERILESLPQLVVPPEQRKTPYRSKYYCRNPANLRYFHRVISRIEAQDLSYIRRLRMLSVLLFIVHHTEKNLKDFHEEDIDRIATVMFQSQHTPTSQESFIRMTKRIWWILFKDRTLWQEIKARQDKSKQRQREDKVTPEEYKALFNYFSDNPEMQFVISIVNESLCRPAELVSLKIKDIEDHGDYALLNTERGKEGIKQLICIDSHPYLKKYLQTYSLRDNPDAYLFTNPARKSNQSIHPRSINKRLQTAYAHLKINKPISLYALKRFGVTSKRLQGYTDNTIIKIAGWTSGRQLSTYDLSTQKEVVDELLVKKGIKSSNGNGYSTLQPKTCVYCGKQDIDFHKDDCPQCLRPLNLEKIKKQMELAEVVKKLPNMEQLVATVQRLEQEIYELKK
jgi:site-specific recombinase XerD